MALIDKASLLMVPSTYEAGKLYNVLPSGNRAPDSTNQNSGYDQTRADFDFDRGSNAAATRVNASGLIEKYRENLLTYSNDFSQWTNSGTTEASGFEGYDGTNDAWEIEKTSASAYSSINRALTATSGIVTISAYVKKGTLSVTSLYASGGTNPYILFSFDSATITAQRPGLIDTNVEDAGNGWYRISFTTTESIAQVTLHPDWAGTNTGTIYAQDIQVEKGLVATDYLESTSVTGKAGVLVDLPRINYDANGENGALLLEPSRQNLVAYSEYFGGTYYVKGSGVSILENNYTSPEGLVNGAKLIGATGTDRSGSVITRIISVSSSTTYTASIYVYKDTATQCTLYLRDGSTGVIVSQSVTLESGWQRIEKSLTTGASTSQMNWYLGNTDGDIGIFGAQIESGSYVSSYIPTMGTSETRAADSCSVTGASDVIGQTEGTIYWEGSVPTADQNANICQFNNSTSASVVLEKRSNGKIRARVWNSGNAVVSIQSSSYGDENLKIAFAYKSGEVALYINGAQIATDSTAFTFAQSLTEFQLGVGVLYFAYPRTSSAKQSMLFNERLTNSELATLTTL